MMSITSRTTTATAVLLIALALAACNRDATPEAEAPADAAATAGTAAPSAAGESAPGAGRVEAAEKPGLQVTTLDGTDYDLAGHRGKWVVVNFWATWCAPCLKEMPELSALDAMHEHVEVIGLAYEDIEPEAMRAFLSDHPVVYPVAIVDTYNPPADFDTPRGLPMTWLIAPDGSVAKKVVGPVTAADIEAAIAAAGGPQPVTQATDEAPADTGKAATEAGAA